MRIFSKSCLFLLIFVSVGMLHASTITIKKLTYRVTQKKGTHLQLQSKTNIFERFKHQKNRADSAVLRVFEAFKSINFGPSYGI